MKKELQIRNMSKKWDQMTGEEREQFIKENPWIFKTFRYLFYAAVVMLVIVVLGEIFN